MNTATYSLVEPQSLEEQQFQEQLLFLSPALTRAFHTSNPRAFSVRVPAPTSDIQQPEHLASPHQIEGPSSSPLLQSNLPPNIIDQLSPQLGVALPISPQPAMPYNTASLTVTGPHSTDPHTFDLQSIIEIQPAEFKHLPTELQSDPEHSNQQSTDSGEDTEPVKYESDPSRQNESYGDVELPYQSEQSLAIQISPQFAPSPQIDPTQSGLDHIAVSATEQPEQNDFEQQSKSQPTSARNSIRHSYSVLENLRLSSRDFGAARKSEISEGINQLLILCFQILTTSQLHLKREIMGFQ